MTSESGIPRGPVHHLTLTVTDVGRARAFYSDILSFQVVGELGAQVLMSNGIAVLALSPARNRPIEGDRFDENRVGLDHASFSVANRGELEEAVRLLDARGVPHGEIKDMGPNGIAVLAFRDPDNIQLELTAPTG